LHRLGALLLAQRIDPRPLHHPHGFDAVRLVPAPVQVARAAGPEVITVQRDGTAHYVNVQLGRDLGQSVEIIAGLTGTERLVLSPPAGLKEGSRVSAETVKGR
jgi:hypothetical protein